MSRKRKLAQRLVELSDETAFRIRVLSWNVSWESTKPCTKGFGELGEAARLDGAATVRQNILNVIDRSHADIIALQETPNEWFDELREHFKRQGYTVDFLFNPHTSGPEGMTTAWRSNLFDGRRWTVKHDTFEGSSGRPIAVIDWGFFIFVNLHAGHDYLVRDFTEKFDFLKMRNSIILAGDFNRSIRQLSFGSGNTYLYNCSTTPIWTCCSRRILEKQNHAGAFDHIFTDLTVYQPTTIVERVFPTSDHLPILSVIILPQITTSKELACKKMECAF